MSVSPLPLLCQCFEKSCGQPFIIISISVIYIKENNDIEGPGSATII